MRIDPDPDGERRRAALERLNPRTGSRRPRRRWLRALGVAVAVWILLSAGVVASLSRLNPPLSAFMIGEWVKARLAGERGFVLQQVWRPLGNIASAATAAMIAAEDQRFLLHRGFDAASIEAALAAHRRGERLRGASTITQQVAKNLFLWPGRSWLRKGLEAWFTVLIELQWSKRRILEVYLNLAQFGRGIYGVEAASRRWFGHSASTLSREEAALLAAVLPNPIRLQAGSPSPYVRQRQRWILRAMAQLPADLLPVFEMPTSSQRSPLDQ